ncbi:hypothetical protein [Curtobacterium sp. MCSS17_016]|nr:hypothetical protein [Curtobacterium sp. MCSS17_016]WIE81212.1 hypothetical protein DEJ19_018435 [Curtobacterium sp. MCSS17_016]
MNAAVIDPYLSSHRTRSNVRPDTAAPATSINVEDPVEVAS